MGPLPRSISLMLGVAFVGMTVAGIALGVSGSDPADVDVSPTVAEQLALFDERPSSTIDDATWLPAPTPTAEVAEAAESSLAVPGEPVTSAPPTTAGTSGALPAGNSPATAAPATSAPNTALPTTAAPTTALPTTALPTGGPSTTAPPAPPSTITRRDASVGFAGIVVADHTNSNVNISQNGQDGSFRTVCTVSHFNSDDAIVFPGQRDATHLHMYFGNTLADFSSTGASLMSSGDATCQGGPLNRSAYWVPAVLDQNGNVRPAQYMLAYYKRAGDEDVVPYPNGLQMVVGNAMAMTTQSGREQPVGAGIDYTWSCGSPITVGKHDAGRLIPNCAPGEFLTLSLIFPRCGDGRLESPDDKSHMAYPPHYGAACPASHPIRHPQLTYNIHWNNNDTNTGGWYLSSDDHRPMGGALMPGGTTTHADWIGAWHPEVLEIMTSGCFNADHDCKGGTISPTLRLDAPNVRGHSPANIYDARVAPVILPSPG